MLPLQRKCPLGAPLWYILAKLGMTSELYDGLLRLTVDCDVSLSCLTAVARRRGYGHRIVPIRARHSQLRTEKKNRRRKTKHAK